jgi:hypothetical protein
MNKPPEAHLPSDYAGRSEGLDPWNEFLSESSDNRGSLQDPSDEFGSEIDANARRRAVQDGFAPSPSVAHDEPPYLGYSDAPSEPGSLVHLVSQRVSQGSVSHSEIAHAISLADVVSRQVPVHWPEAVATVQALCASLLTDGSAGAPAMEEVLITPTGLVLARDDAWSERDVRNVGLILHALLSTSIPPLPLRLFVTASMSSQRYSSIELYAEALSLYAAPEADGTELVRTLYRRCLDSVSAPPPQGDRPRVDGRRSKSRWIVPLAAAAAAAVVTAGAVLSFLDQSPWRVNAEPKAQVEPAPPAVEANAVAAPTPAPAPAPRDMWKPGSVVTSTRQRPENASPFLPAHSPLQLRVSLPASSGAEGVSARAEVQPAFEPAPELPLASQEVPRPLPTRGSTQTDTRIYSGEDADVQPPQMLSPSMSPTLSGPSLDRASVTIELVIDENGVVQSVKHLTPPTRLVDAGLGSTFKLMKFRPAQRGGAPVKYRLRLTVNSSQS